MTENIENFRPGHDYIICIDSDGTILDAMNVKHNYCHGPSFIQTFGLESYREEVQKKWNEINLFNTTRGCNRFLAMLEILREYNGKYVSIDLKDLEDWVASTGELSGSMLEKELQKKPDSEILKKALVFSKLVNEKIAALSPKDKPPFDGVIEGLEYARQKVDIAIVSSSNMAAIKEEWGYYNLLKYPELVTSLEMGTKKECLEKIIKRGYAPDHVLMMGDAFPDVDSAGGNGVYFYPVLINHEKESWTEFKEKYLDIFTAGRYGEVQETLLERFHDNFGKI